MNKKEYIYTPSVDECKAIFASSCVESVARATGSSATDTYLRMARINLINDYILPCYDVLHTESRENVTKDLLKTIEIWESKKLNK